MTGRGRVGGPGRSPLEIAAIVLALAAMTGVGVLWGAGIMIGSLLGATLPGSASEGIAAILHSFPDVGQAWEPPVSSRLVWAVAVGVAAAFGPLVLKMLRTGRLSEEGTQWATKTDLRRAGLIVSDGLVPHAQTEEPHDAT